jgi:hypothetical protein
MGTSEESHRRIYAGKVILAKSPSDLNYSQRRRYRGLTGAIKGLVREYLHADGREVRVGSTRILVSPSLPHGPEGSRTGRVVGVTIDDGDSLTVIPDVQGPISAAVTEYVLSMRPSVLIIGGPPFYLMGTAFTEEEIIAGLGNLRRIIEEASPERLIITHHALRSLDWRERLGEVFNVAREYGVRIETFAQILGKEEELLEAKRSILWGGKLGRVNHDESPEEKAPWDEETRG